MNHETAIQCPSCRAAEVNQFTGSYHAGCENCSARMLANSPQAWNAIHKGQAAQLQEAIRKTWGDEYNVGRQMVWEWIQKLTAARAAKGI